MKNLNGKVRIVKPATKAAEPVRKSSVVVKSEEMKALEAKLEIVSNISKAAIQLLKDRGHDMSRVSAIREFYGSFYWHTGLNDDMIDDYLINHPTALKQYIEQFW